MAYSAATVPAGCGQRAAIDARASARMRRRSGVPACIASNARSRSRSTSCWRIRSASPLAGTPVPGSEAAGAPARRAGALPWSWSMLMPKAAAMRALCSWSGRYRPVVQLLTVLRDTPRVPANALRETPRASSSSRRTLAKCADGDEVTESYTRSLGVPQSVQAPLYRISLSGVQPTLYNRRVRVLPR
jgi:hypothetical protein